MEWRQKKADRLGKWLGSDGELGESCEEWFVWQASKILAMPYAELDEHAKKHSLMATAFTLNSAEKQGDEIAKAIVEQRKKLDG